MINKAVKMLFSTVFVLFVAGCSTCCAADCKTNGKTDACKPDAKAQCTCPVIMVTGGEEAGDGNCTVCTVWCEAYSPCMNAIAACPAQSGKTLEKAPLCDKCKEVIMQHAEARKQCGVCGKDDKPCAACKDKMMKTKVCQLMTKGSMKANMNCKACHAKAAADAKAADANSNVPVIVVTEEEDVITVTPVNDNAAKTQTPAKPEQKKDDPAPAK